MKIYALLISILILFLLAACSGKTNYHKTAMPDPQSFNAHFGDMDKNGDEIIDWDEFKAHFPKAKTKVFNVIDLDTNGGLDHDEWHAFKEAHGMKHHE